MRRIQVLLCSGTACQSSGSDKVKRALLDELGSHDLLSEVQIVETGCMGPCELGPVLLVYPEGTFYVRVKPDDAAEIVSEHFLKGRPVRRLLWTEGAPQPQEIPFFSRQMKLVLRNCGTIDPEKIEEYIATGGYEALGKVVTLDPAQVIAAVKESGLRGRGGAGFPTGTKWELVRAATGDTKYVICNADEGDPGAFMDRAILEGDPHAVLEGMAIAAYAVGASRGYVYVRAEYPLAIRRLEVALAQARKLGLLGARIFESDFSFDIELRMGAGAFVCGEETALMASIEGRRGEPRPRPPYPATHGLWGKPTLINNVETFANVRHIVLGGAAAFAAVGTEKSKGTKVFALAGKVRNTGLVEVPMGITLRELVFDIGGGVPAGREFKAVQIGGPSGGCLPASLLDTPVDYDSLSRHGAIMGSGGVIVLDDATCMVNMARFFLEFTADESCGKCVPCRVGTQMMLAILNRIVAGEGTDQDLVRLAEIGDMMKNASLCALGQTAPNPVLSTLRYFPEEYRAHIRDRSCPAGVCPNLVRYVVVPEACRGCDACRRACPTGAAQGTAGKAPYRIADELCIRCGACFDACPFGAVKKEPR
ncbi:MAG TPA: NADH-ubiquinone oxidoreductase-F iron-sulfur binding region domain-containing protein [Candidatus Bipolaricaulis sp.]|nr:NADH-ubiquinone oxidoreductase-F iron-sulfur binding region domain-containing protein [Candidatus Bipolaricaulis sp.]MDY0391959.1 NADH-ubiquinone oxidoreductase-F iron-sulfur binding region domain-containing protein [Candidatus Bipolaricaulis sp.]HPD06781.1 NADH-ubiquinone oxidoreductase-F iron-sulfur binding region domain-containing protein [Candidatus Bipolaricaulis sp.]HRS13428.1 NADH-ubiquinone oxidoreductase-F iron-sulfur binding region domain-containing protein [Candidatus Bipolaricauli